MSITIKDIARRAQVSYTTVSLAFQQNSRISTDRRRQILKIAEELGYVPNRQARALKGGGTQTIGVLINDVTNPFFSLVARAAGEAASARGYEVLVADSRWQVKHELVEIQRMIQAGVDGVLACFSESGRESSVELERHKIPCLALDAVSSDFPGAYVANDIPAAARLAVEHLLEVGCRDIVFFNGDEQIKESVACQLLAREFFDTLQRHDRRPNEEQIFCAGLTIDAGRQAMEKVLQSGTVVDGLFCANTLCAMGAMESAQRAGMRIGRDLAVVGIDDLDICELECISLTTIRQPYKRLAEVATNLLLDCIQNHQMPDLRMALRPELIVRNSTRRKPA